jgi:hypothetical protein
MEDNIHYQTPSKNMYQSYINNILNDQSHSELKSASAYTKETSQNSIKNHLNSNANANGVPPRSTYSENSFKDFLKICKAYYKELKHFNKEATEDKEREIKHPQELSKDDMIVLNDLIKEIILYSNLLLKNKFFEETKKMIKIGEKICDVLLKNLNNGKDGQINPQNISQNNIHSLKIVYPLSLKLQILEIKFDLHFNSQNNFEDAEKILLEIIKIQNILHLPKFNLGCSNFYLAMVKFCKIITFIFKFFV